MTDLAITAWMHDVQATPWWRALVAKRGERGALLELKAQATKARWEQVRADARADVNVFMAMCFKNDQAAEGTPPFEQQWFHREWQDIWLTSRVSCIHGATGYGKSDQVIGHLLWRLGRNPKLRVIIIGKQEQNASRTLLKIKRQIESNKVLRAIFPDLQRAPDGPWSTEKLRLAGAGLDITTNNVEVYGLTGSPQGVRGDFLLLDDVIDLENTRADEERKKTIEFVDTVVQSRRTTFGQLHIIANAWHGEDLAFTYSKRPGVRYGCFPAEHPETGALLWPSFRSREWLQQTRDGMTPSRYARMFLCVPNSEDSRLFESPWFARAQSRGQGLKPMREVRHAFGRDGQVSDPALLHVAYAAEQKRLRIVIGGDLSTGKKEKKRKSDWTVFFVVALHTNGDRQILWVEAGRWSAPVILAKMIELETRYKPDRFIVESNGSQRFLHQFAGEVPDFESAIDEFDTSGTKWDEAIGIEEIGVELQAGRWLSPGPAAGESEDAYRERLTTEERDAFALIRQSEAHLLDFSRVGHTSDFIMAWYFAKEGVKRLLTGTFSHRSAKPAEQAQRELAGPAGTMAALYPPAPHGGFVVPSPYDPPAAPAEDAPHELPDHVRRILGLSS